MIDLPIVDIHGYGEESEFDKAFVKCLWDGVYPGPTEINKRRAPKFERFNKLNGRLTKRRLQLMTWFGIPYKYGWATVLNVGELPYPDDPQRNTLNKEMFAKI